MNIRKQIFIGVHQLIPRADPYTIPSTERYYPYKERIGSATMKSLARVRRRKKSIPIHNRADYEIHFTTKTIQTSTIAVERPDITVATMFTVHACDNKIDCKNGGTAIIYGPEGHEVHYLRKASHQDLQTVMAALGCKIEETT